MLRLVVFLLLLAVGTSADCDELSGEWRNQKGSVLRLEQIKHQLHGTFMTSVEVAEGAAGNGAVHVRGWTNDDMVSFAVKYPTSMVAFTGQCYEKNGKETLHTSWLLHSKQDTCDDLWLATRIGQDKFVRIKARSNRQFSNEDM